jgi:hypothetical protein
MARGYNSLSFGGWEKFAEVGLYEMDPVPATSWRAKCGRYLTIISRILRLFLDHNNKKTDAIDNAS